MKCEKELDMRSEKEGFQTTQRPPQEVSRRPRTSQGPEVGANLAPKRGSKIDSKSMSEAIPKHVQSFGALGIGRFFFMVIEPNKMKP